MKETDRWEKMILYGECEVKRVHIQGMLKIAKIAVNKVVVDDSQGYAKREQNAEIMETLVLMSLIIPKYFTKVGINNKIVL